MSCDHVTDHCYVAIDPLAPAANEDELNDTALGEGLLAEYFNKLST